MKGRVVRTALVAVVWGGFLAVAVLPAVDAMGRLLLVPPSFGPAARILLGAFWAVGVAAAWAYRPAPGPGSAPGRDP